MNTDKGAWRRDVISLAPTTVVSILTDFTRNEWTTLSSRWCDRVVAFDTSLETVARLYLKVRKAKLPILPLVMDFKMPTPSYGLFNHHFVAATERFQCDMVVAPRLVRHCECADRRLDVERIVEGLSIFSTRWCIIGYLYPEGNGGSSGSLDRQEYANLESFTSTVRRRFSTVDVISFEKGAGALLICEK